MKETMSAKVTPRIPGIYVFLVGIVSVLLMGGYFLHLNFDTLIDRESWVTHTWNIIDELDLLQTSFDFAETEQRGFLLTQQDEYLNHYRGGIPKIWNHFNNVKLLSLDNPVQQQNLDILKPIIEERLALLDTNLNSVIKGGVSALPKANVRRGQDLMLSCSQVIQSMQENEKSLLADRVGDSERSRSYFIWSLVTMLIASIVSIVTGFRKIRQNEIATQLDSEKKHREALFNNMVAELASQVAGDLSTSIVSKRVLAYLGQKFSILAGHFYYAERDQLKLLASYAGTEEKLSLSSADAQIRVGQGLLGEAFLRKEIWSIENVPNDYFKINSATGASLPKSLLFIPISFQGRNVGVLELASFSSFDQDFREFLNASKDVVGVSLSAAQSREYLQNLLEKTQHQAEELQAQQKNLQTQQEELRANNEELEQQAREMEAQQQTLTIQNKELESAREDVEHKAADLQRASHYKSEFLAKMSHELRTPLNSLLILATLLIENKEKNLTDQQKQFAKSLHQSGSDLLNLVNDILDLSKIEARKLSLRAEKFTLKDLFGQLKSTFDAQAKSKGLNFVMEIPARDSGLTLFTDRQRLEQVLRNFLSNALKFTEKGTITLGVLVNQGQNTVSIFVKDTGIGIAQEKKDLIFEAFEQADGSVSRKYGGTGLGLTISRELAFMLGGQIRLNSEEGQGSEFIIDVPTQLPNKEAAATMDEIPAAVRRQPVIVPPSEPAMVNDAVNSLKGVSGTTHTMLIVEDDEAFSNAVAETVRGYGFQPIQAKSGELALEILNHHNPSAILLDIKLPGISGLGLLELIKQKPHLRHVPIHMVSALEHQQSALRMGALGYLGKPVTMDKVRSAISRIENLLARKMKRLLVVEDDEIQRQAIQALVAGSDVEVVGMRTGDAALREIEKNQFDCIILDLSLPDISGFELLGKLYSLSISLPPIVIYTGKDLSREEEEHLQKYSESIIIKGARSPERLLDEVNLFLHRVEALLPRDKQEMLVHLRSQEKALEGKKVLLVDDDVRNIFALTSALESKGLVVQVARNGLEALSALENKKSKFDIVLMDLMMPKMDGLEAIRRIREMREHKDLPIIALTAKAMKEDHEKCMEAGANDYLPKPINLMNLFSVMKVWLVPKGIFS